MSLRPRIAFSVSALSLSLLLCPGIGSAQQTLGGITGVVTDGAGAILPGTTVVVTSIQTGLTRTQTAGSNGFYAFANLPIGDYSLTFTHDGFKVQKIPSISVQSDRTAGVNATLSAGGASDSITVDASPLMNVTDTTNGYVLEKEQIETTPLPTGAFTGLAIFSPGVSAELPGGTGANSGLGNQPIWANGQRDISNSFQLNGVDASNLFNGKSTSQSGGGRVVNNTGVGNSGAGGVEQSSASIYLAIGNALPTPAPETIEEARVNASMYDASQGSSSGAHIDISTATGTNAYHGSIYGRRGTDWINAAPFFFKNDPDIPASQKVPQLHRSTAGMTLGGPIVKDKLFFFLGYQHVHVADQEIGTSRLTVPVGLDNTSNTRTPAGLAAIANKNFGSGTSAGGISPVASFLFNYQLPNGQYMIPGQTPGVVPSATHPTNASIPGTAYFAADQAVADVDYNATHKDTVAVKYFWQHDPTVAPYAYSNVPGFTEYMDAGAHVFSITNTYFVKSNLSTTQTLGFDRMKAYGTNAQPFTAQQAGISAFGSSYFPGISIIDVLGNDNVGGQNPDYLYNTSLNIGPGAFTQGPFTGVIQNRIMPSANGIWTLGKHTIGFGGSYNYTQLNIRDQRTGKGMIATSDYGNFAQGNIAAQNSSFTTTTFLVGNANRYYRANQVGAYVQDKFQVTSNLSLTAGVRYDWNGGLTEKNGNIFNFNPAAYKFNSSCLTTTDDNPADCYPSNGIVIAGNNAQGTPGASKTTLTGRQWGFGPRLGIAWQPAIFHSKVAVRAGTGIYYDRGENFSFLSAGYAIGEVTGGPFGAVQAPPFVNAVQCDPSGQHNGKTPGANCGGTYSLSTPFGSATSIIQPTGKAADLTQYLQTPDQIINGGQLTTITTYAQDNKLPYTMNYTLDVQWQPTNKTVVEVGYVGNLARHQVVPVPLNQSQVATAGNPINGQTYSYGYAVQTAGNSYCYYNCSPAHLPNGQTYMSNYEGGNVDLRVPYVGYAAESETYKAAGVAAYNALQTHVEQRVTYGLTVGASYTYSHALDEQSDIGLFYTGNNALNLRGGYGSADFDRTHVLSVNFNYKIPSPYSEHSLPGKFTAGWSIAGTVIAQSGQPFSVIDFSGAVGSLYFSTYDGITNPVVPLAKGKTPQSVKTGASGAFGTSYFKNNPSDPSFTVPLIAPGTKGVPGASSDAPNGDIYETDFTSGQRNIFRQSAQKRADISLIKEIGFFDHYKLRYTFDVFNLTNTASFDIPTAEVTQNAGYNPTPSADQGISDFYSAPSNAGYVQHTIGSPRQIQMSLHAIF